MKLVSRDILEALLKNPLPEDEGISFSYAEFLREYQKVTEEFREEKPWNKRYLIDNVYEILKDGYLKKNCPPIAFCGEGSSRAAYALLGGKCLKIATCERGIAQNKQEVQNMKQGKDLLCFAKLYDYDEGGASLMTECCCEAKFQDFEKAYRCPSVEDMYDVLYELIQKKCDFKKAKESLEDNYQEIEGGMLGAPDYLTQLDIAQWKINFLGQIEKEDGVQWKVLRDLVAFYRRFGVGELDVGDLANEANWGMAIREGKIIPVVIDAGLSEDVYSEYYM